MSTSFKPELDFDVAVSNGDIKGFQHFAQFGYNDDLQNGTEANLWSGPTDIYVFPNDNGEAMEMVSDNVADNQTLLIQALDENWDQVNIPLALNGTTPVALPFNVARINRVINISPTEFAGNVEVRGAGGGTVYCVALPIEQISTQVIFSVPNGFNAKLETSIVTLNRSGNTDAGVIFRYRRRNFGGVFGTGARFGLNKRGNSVSTLEVGNVAPLPPKSDVVLLATADNNGTDASARLPFTLYEA